MINTIHAVAVAIGLVLVPVDARPAPDPAWDLSLEERAASGNPEAWARVFGDEPTEDDAAREPGDCACRASDGSHVDSSSAPDDDAE